MKQPNKCACETCECMLKLKKLGNSRSEFYCRHHNQKHINDYYKEKGIFSMPGFLGFAKEGFPKKRNPPWCPKKVKK